MPSGGCPQAAIATAASPFYPVWMRQRRADARHCMAPPGKRPGLDSSHAGCAASGGLSQTGRLPHAESAQAAPGLVGEGCLGAGKLLGQVCARARGGLWTGGGLRTRSERRGKRLRTPAGLQSGPAGNGHLIRCCRAWCGDVSLVSPGIHLWTPTHLGQTIGPASGYLYDAQPFKQAAAATELLVQTRNRRPFPQSNIGADHHCGSCSLLSSVTI